MEGDFSANWTTQLRKGLLELCVLNILGGRRLHGYDIVKTLGAIEDLVISEGTVYPILNRLKGEGFLTTSIEESSGGPARKYYELTGTGRRQLDWMNEYWQRLNDAMTGLRKGAVS